MIVHLFRMISILIPHLFQQHPTQFLSSRHDHLISTTTDQPISEYHHESVAVLWVCQYFPGQCFVARQIHISRRRKSVAFDTSLCLSLGPWYRLHLSLCSGGSETCQFRATLINKSIEWDLVFPRRGRCKSIYCLGMRHRRSRHAPCLWTCWISSSTHCFFVLCCFQQCGATAIIKRSTPPLSYIISKRRRSGSAPSHAILQELEGQLQCNHTIVRALD